MIVKRTQFHVHKTDTKDESDKWEDKARGPLDTAAEKYAAPTRTMVAIWRALVLSLALSLDFKWRMARIQGEPRAFSEPAWEVCLLFVNGGPLNDSAHRLCCSLFVTHKLPSAVDTVSSCEQDTILTISCCSYVEADTVRRAASLNFSTPRSFQSRSNLNNEKNLHCTRLIN